MRLAGLDRPELRAFMREAAQRGALLRRGVRVEWIDLQHPSVGVDDVAIVIAAVVRDAELLGIPAAVVVVRGVGCHRCPQLATIARDAVARERSQFLRGALRIVDRGRCGGNSRRSSLRR